MPKCCLKNTLFITYFTLLQYISSQSVSSLSLRPLAECQMHMTYGIGNTPGVSKSSSYWMNSTGFPGDTCVAFLSGPLGNKAVVTPKPLALKKKAIVFKTDSMIN